MHRPVVNARNYDYLALYCIKLTMYEIYEKRSGYFFISIVDSLC